MINKILDELEKQHQIPKNIFRSYEFEIRGNKIFIMTKPVNQFNKIKAVRKGLLFAIKKGKTIKFSDSPR